MQHASLRDLKAIYRHFQAHRDVFPHIRQDALKRRIEARQCVYQGGVVVTYQRYRKRTRVGNVQVPAGAIMLHQIVNSSQFNGAGRKIFRQFVGEIVKSSGGDLYLTVRKENVEQASLLSVEPASLPDIQRLLPEGITLLEYLVTGPETLLWVVTRDRVTVVRLPLARAALVAEVRALRQAVEAQAPLPALQAQARALYDHLLAPARPHLAGDRLLLIPHDVLHYLPWAALRTPADKWLMEEATLATLPSARVLMFLQKKGTGTGAQTLAVGNPDVGPALNLRYAEREARAVGAHYPGATVLVRQDATETRVKALSAKAGLLHLATHGELDEKDPLSSALLLVPGGADDGRLEVRKIFGLDLHARLVVLSACETGLGKLSKGDELVGLQRAFLYAGTPAVVTTLWKVDDRASFRLMEAFYDALDARGPAGALRQAQQETMAAFPHPFAWAAFGLTGMPR